MKYELAEDIKNIVGHLVNKLRLKHINIENIHCIRSLDAKTKAYARIWGMSRLFKEVARLEPHYIIEVNARKFDSLSRRDQIKTLIHELLHIPKTFSGSLLPHRGKHHRIDDKIVESIIRRLE